MIAWRFVHITQEPQGRDLGSFRRPLVDRAVFADGVDSSQISWFHPSHASAASGSGTRTNRVRCMWARAFVFILISGVERHGLVS
jgi:hypothetical protein